MKQQQTRERVFDLVLSQMAQVDLNNAPVNVTAEFADSKVAEIHVLVRYDCYGTKADDADTAATNLADVEQRRKFLKGETISFFAGSGKIWLMTADGTEQTAAVDKEIYKEG